MHICAISTCENSIEPSDSISLHRFPLGNANLLKKWIFKMKLTEANPPVSSFLCSKHFLSTSFLEGKLKHEAIPCLDAVEEFAYETIPQENKMIRKKSLVEENIGAFVCRICSCKLNTENMISIYDDEKGVLDKIIVCLPILVNEEYDLPNHICGACFNQLERMYLIRSLSISTESLLQKYIDDFHFMDGYNNELDESDKGKFWVTEDQLLINGPTSCNICDKEFRDMEQFDDHIEHHLSEENITEQPVSGTPDIVCSDCGLVFKKDSSYREHNRYQKYECGSCEITLFSFCEMKAHVCVKYNFTENDAIENNVNTNYFDFDNKKITSAKERNDAKKTYHCSLCNRHFQRESNWVKHKIKHKSGDFQNCKVCNQQFDSMENFNRHMNRAHVDNKGFMCRYCGKHTTTKLSLNIHERIHTGAKPFICEWCGNAFRSKANLSQHQAQHTGIRRHACKVCDKKFSRKSFLTTHMRVHTGERPYACDICQQRFTQVGDMRRHRRRHLLQKLPQKQPEEDEQPQEDQQPQILQLQSQNGLSNVMLHQIFLKEEKNDNQEYFGNLIHTAEGDVIQVGLTLADFINKPYII